MYPINIVASFIHQKSWEQGYNLVLISAMGFLMDFRLLSRDRQSSEQFAGLNHRYDEMQAECALVPLTISDTSQEEAL